MAQGKLNYALSLLLVGGSGFRSSFYCGFFLRMSLLLLIQVVRQYDVGYRAFQIDTSTC
jgi:hypothetical protein